MGLTTNRSIPYPEPTDLVTQGAAAMKAIAEKVDTELGPKLAYATRSKPGAANIANDGGAWTRLVHDDDEGTTAGITYSNGVFTVAKAGRYDMAVQVRFGVSANAGRKLARIVQVIAGVAGAKEYVESETLPGSSPQAPPIVMTRLAVPLAAGESFAVEVLNSTGGTVALVGGTAHNFVTIAQRS